MALILDSIFPTDENMMSRETSLEEQESLRAALENSPDKDLAELLHDLNLEDSPDKDVRQQTKSAAPNGHDAHGGGMAAERARLIKESEVKLAEMAARAAVAKGKADEDLQRRIAGKQPSSLRPHTRVA